MTGPTDLPRPPEIPSAVTFERVRAVVARSGFEADDDGTLLRRRNELADLEISLPESDGVVLLIRGSRRGEPYPDARRRTLEAFVNDWHRERAWPTVVLADGEAGTSVHAHVGIDATAGLTTVQLRDWLRVAIGTIEQCFTHLDQAPGVGEPSEHPDP